jgi:GNAT superfamily N-acetyltransferase
MIKELKLPKAGTDVSIAVLRPEHLDRVLVLQGETRAALPDAQKMFVLPQSPEYFSNLLARQNGLMLGVWLADKLIAQMALMGSLSLEDAIARNAITRNDVMFHHAGAFESVVVAKSMSVHPAWRGHELSAAMLDAALTLPLARAADHVFAQISADNVRSWDLFLRAGFGIVAAGVDPSDHKPRFIMQKPAIGFGLHYAPGQTGVDPAADFAAIMRLTEREALIGRPAGGDAFKLAFYASTELAAVWSDAPIETPASAA